MPRGKIRDQAVARHHIEAGGGQRRDDRSGARSRPPAPASSARGVSFEDSFDQELEREFGELGPDPRARRGGRRGGRGPR